MRIERTEEPQRLAAEIRVRRDELGAGARASNRVIADKALLVFLQQTVGPLESVLEGALPVGD